MTATSITTNILHIDSSINGDNSVSRTLSRSIVDQLKTLNPNALVIRRDLTSAPLPHLTLDAFANTAVIDEFLAANIVVIGSPMYNFGIPSQLKAWLDRLAVPEKTFRYTAQGPQGLAGDKKVIVASSRGGFYGADTPYAALDHQESYLRTFFDFLGVTDLTFIRAEGIAVGEGARDKAIAAARSQVSRLAV
jgi:FMN-dependent NADH-azoreductase